MRPSRTNASPGGLTSHSHHTIRVTGLESRNEGGSIGPCRWRRRYLSSMLQGARSSSRGGAPHAISSNSSPPSKLPSGGGGGAVAEDGGWTIDEVEVRSTRRHLTVSYGGNDMILTGLIHEMTGAGGPGSLPGGTAVRGRAGFCSGLHGGRWWMIPRCRAALNTILNPIGPLCDMTGDAHGVHGARRERGLGRPLARGKP